MPGALDSHHLLKWFLIGCWRASGRARALGQPFSTYRGVDRCKVQWPCRGANDVG